MNSPVKATVLVILLGLSVAAPKTLDGAASLPHTEESGHSSGVVALLWGLVASSGLGSDLQGWLGALAVPKILQVVKENGRGISDALGVSEDFMRPLVRLLDGAEKLRDKEAVTAGKTQAAGNPKTNTIDGGAGKGDLTSKFLTLAKNVFLEEYGGLDTLMADPGTQDSPMVLPSLNLTSINLWEVVRSTWARVLSYVEEQNSLESFLQRTPVKVIDRVLSLGDDLNLASFLAKKLDPEFAQFLAGKAEPLLGPLRHADSIANLTQAAGLGGALDYLLSERFANTVAAMSRFVSAYLEDAVSEDVVTQYIDFISFSNPELNHFYRSVLRSDGNSTQGREDAAAPPRHQRDVLKDIASIHRYDPDAARLHPDPSYPASTALTDPSSRQLQNRYGSASSYGSSATLYDPSRDGYGYGGGHGGGGYGGYGMNMNTLDPYVVLGSLALGTILGFLLFRALRGTGGGRRDIGDGSLSLWQSDLPFPGTSRALRAERAAPDGSRQGLALPPALRGDVWSSAPLVDDGTTTGLSLEEDDLADHLNQLWRAHRGNASTTCVRRRLCGQLVGPGATHAGLALLLSSTSSLLGVARSGQLLDDVTGSLVTGNTYSCPSAACSSM